MVERDEAPRLVRGGLRELGDVDGFDLVTAWHVIEHLDDPRASLSELRQHLADDGRLLVCVPNVDSWQSRVFKGSWFHLDPPRHLHHFSKQSLTRVLADAGLQPVGWRWWVPEYGMSGWIQSTLNRSMRQPNVLYEAVKDRNELEDLTPGRRRALVALSLAAAIPLAVVALPIEAMAAWSRASATLTVAAAAI
jgi:SAM-dependent methyltransferase